MNSETPQAPNNSKPKPKQRVSTIEAVGMMLLALLGDVIGLIPIIGFVGTIMCGGGVVMWLYFKGVKPMSFKKGKKAVGKVLNLLGNGVAEGATGAVFPSVLIYTGIALTTAFIEDKADSVIPTPLSTKNPINVRQLSKPAVAGKS